MPFLRVGAYEGRSKEQVKENMPGLTSPAVNIRSPAA